MARNPRLRRCAGAVLAVAVLAGCVGPEGAQKPLEGYTAGQAQDDARAIMVEVEELIVSPTTLTSLARAGGLLKPLERRCLPVGQDQLMVHIENEVKDPTLELSAIISSLQDSWRDHGWPVDKRWGFASTSVIAVPREGFQVFARIGYVDPELDGSTSRAVIVTVMTPCYPRTLLSHRLGPSRTAATTSRKAIPGR